jgi:hypothetical protein
MQILMTMYGKWSAIVVGPMKCLALKNTSTMSVMYSQTGFVLTVTKRIRLKRSLKLSSATGKQLQISYRVEGVRVVNVWLPEGVELPPIWSAMTLEHQDEWLYAHQAKSETFYEDIHYSQAENVLEVRHLRAV